MKLSQAEEKKRIEKALAKRGIASKKWSTRPFKSKKGGKRK